MRIWDINPGYLSRDLLLAEHRILHETVTLVTARKSVYGSQESMRWSGFGWALKQRHALLVAELNLRGFADITPVLTRSGKGSWPALDSEEPIAQLQMLADEYAADGEGRIPLPANARQLWAQHEYSVMARDQGLYSRTGRRVAGMRRKDDYTDLAHRLTLALQRPPSASGLHNALQHMWGHVSASTAWPAAPGTTHCRASEFWVWSETDSVSTASSVYSAAPMSQDAP